MFNYNQETAIWGGLGGYVTIPLRGKRPLTDNWTDPVNRPIEAMPGYGEKWSERDITGYGVLLGTPAGHGYVVVAIDIDLEDYDQILEIRATVPFCNMMKCGKKGVTMFFRTTPELAKSRVYKGMVDYLGIGRQTVMPPSIHPETQKPYTWYEGTGWVEPHDLEILNEGHIEQMEEQLFLMGWDRRYADNTARHQLRAVASDVDRVEGDIGWLNRQALDNLPAWVEELGFNGGWRGARYACVNTLRSSSTGRPDAKRKRNLSISPYGIKDFGSNDTYSPIDLVVAAQASNINAAYKWLSERVDPHWEKKQDIEQLLAKAPKVEKSKTVPQAERQVSAETLSPMIKRLMGPIPRSACEGAPGFIGRLYREILRGAPNMPPTIAILAAISTCSAITARRYVGESRGSTLALTTYTAALADTGSGKNHAITFGARFISACADLKDPRCLIYDYGLPWERLKAKREGPLKPTAEGGINAMHLLLAADDLTGDSALFASFWNCALPWFRLDEFGTVFAQLTTPKNQTVPVSSLFRKYYLPTPRHIGKQYALNQTVSDELRKCRSTPIHAPSPTIFGVSTPEQMYSALDLSMAEDGTINRFIIASESGHQETVEETMHSLFGATDTQEIDEDVCREAIEIFVFRSSCGEARSGPFGFLGYISELDDRMDVFRAPEWIVVRAADKSVKSKMAAYFNKQVNRVPDSASQSEFGEAATARVGENMMRLAYLAAVCDNPLLSEGGLPIVQHAHVDWAIEVMDAVKANLVGLVSDHIVTKDEKRSRTSEERIRRNVLHLIREAEGGSKLSEGCVLEGGWVNVSQLHRKCGGQYREVDRKTMKAMVETGEAEFCRVAPPAGSKASSQYFRIKDLET